MKKTLIALTLAALPVASMAEVTLFGTIKGGLEVTKVKGANNTITNANDWESNIGFKGEEDLGNGLKAIWQLQSKASIDHKDTRNDRSYDLTSFIGLDAGAFGKLRAGHLPDAIKDNMEDLNLDDSAHDVRDLDKWEIGSRYTGVRYDTANLAGFSANILYSPEDNGRYDQARNGSGHIHTLSSVAPVVNDITRNTWLVSVGLNYEIAGFFVKYGYIHQNDRIAEKANADVHRIMAGYDANNVFVGLGYQFTKGFDGLAAGQAFTDSQGNTIVAGKNGEKAEDQQVVLSAAYRVGNVVPRLSYAHGFKQELGGQKLANSKYHQVVVGADYHLSKRTTVIGSLGWMKEGKDRLDREIDTYDVIDNGKGTNQAYSFGLGLRHKF